jgi:hypothetical protein
MYGGDVFKKEREECGHRNLESRENDLRSEKKYDISN